MSEDTQWRIFVGIGSFIAVIAVIYWFVSYEAAGTVMLALASGLALFSGTFLYRHREVPDEATLALEAAPAGVPTEPYLPEASIWPFVIGLSAALSLNGLIVGWPYAVPGAALLGLGVVGWISQARRRA
jgi:hypothetical protein